VGHETDGLPLGLWALHRYFESGKCATSLRRRLFLLQALTATIFFISRCCQSGTPANRERDQQPPGRRSTSADNLRRRVGEIVTTRTVLRSAKQCRRPTAGGLSCRDDAEYLRHNGAIGTRDQHENRRRDDGQWRGGTGRRITSATNRRPIGSSAK